VKLRDLERHLREHFCAKEREGGRHTIWSSGRSSGTAAVPRHSEIKTRVVRDVCEKLGIPLPGK